jgi:hypothetical protein
MFAAPAGLHFCFGARDIAIEGFDGFGLEIEGGAETRAGG